VLYGCQWLAHEVGDHFVCIYVGKLDFSVLNLLAYEVIFDINVLRSRVILRILSQLGLPSYHRALYP